MKANWLEIFRKKFPDEFEERRRLVEEKGVKAIVDYIYKKYSYLGKDLNCSNCWACQKKGVRGDFTPVVKCRFIPVWRRLDEGVCGLFYPKNE
jgi:hypothetical protein